MNIERLVAHIPARAGSKRVASKNLRLLDGKPMIAYAIECAQSVSRIEEIYVNTDSREIADLAKTMGVKVFDRDPSLATDRSTGDDFTMDIIEKLGLDTLMMISPVCPLVSPEDVNQAIVAYEEGSDVDALISCSEQQMQTAMNGEFLNIDPLGPLAPSQENPVIQICNWAVTIWNCDAFRENYLSRKSGYCGTKRILFPIDALRSVKVSHEEDFFLAEALMKIKKEGFGRKKPMYWSSK